MDLSFIQEQLDTFATFAGAIGDFLQKPAEFFGGLVDWFTEGEDGTTPIADDWETTQNAFGSSNGGNGAAESENAGE